MPASFSRKSLQVLVVDDFPPMADHLADVIRQQGFTVRTAYDGANALLVAASFRPDVLISDVHMPGLNGFQLAEEFTRRFPECAIVLVTIDPRIFGESYDQRNYRVLQKPVPLEELFRFLDGCGTGT